MQEMYFERSGNQMWIHLQALEIRDILSHDWKRNVIGLNWDVNCNA